MRRGEISLNWPGTLLILIGISYLMYCIMFRNKVTLYFKDIKIVEGKEQKYLKLQLYFSVLNSLVLISMGITIVVYNLNTVYFVLIPLLFHLINFAMKLVSKIKRYVES